MSPSFRSALLAAVTAAAVMGCSGPDPVAVRPHPEALRIAALTDSLSRTAVPADRAALVARRLRAGGVTPLAAGSFSAADGVVAGYVPGRQPLGRPTLVVVGTSMQSGAVPAVLEAARVLVARSRWETVPERTVMVAFWDGPDAAEGLRRTLSGHLWPSEAVARVLVVDAAAPDLAVPAVMLSGGTDVAAAERLVERIATAARYVAPSDSLASL